MVGLNVQEPETTCDDPNCPFHGTLPVRGQVLEGVVVSNKAERTITVERSYYKFIKKYERYEKRKSKIKTDFASSRRIELQCAEGREGNCGRDCYPRNGNSLCHASASKSRLWMGKELVRSTLIKKITKFNIQTESKHSFSKNKQFAQIITQ